MAATPRVDRPHRPKDQPLPPSLRTAFERAYIDAYSTAPDRRAFRAAAVIREFLQTHGHEVSSTACYRWATELRDAGALEHADPITILADDDGTDDAAGVPQADAFAVVNYLREAVMAARSVMAAARRGPHRAEDAKLMIMAAESLRRTSETIIRLNDSVWNLRRIEQFHEELIEIVRTFTPEGADACLLAMERVARDWANGRRATV